MWEQGRETPGVLVAMRRNTAGFSADGREVESSVCNDSGGVIVWLPFAWVLKSVLGSRKAGRRELSFDGSCLSLVQTEQRVVFSAALWRYSDS